MLLQTEVFQMTNTVNFENQTIFYKLLIKLFNDINRLHDHTGE